MYSITVGFSPILYYCRPDVVTLGNPFDTMKRFCLYSQCSHLNLQTLFHLRWMLRRFRCVQILLKLRAQHYYRTTTIPLLLYGLYVLPTMLRYERTLYCCTTTQCCMYTYRCKCIIPTKLSPPGLYVLPILQQQWG